MNCKCYCCREHGECFGSDDHRSFLPAQHKDGAFYWGPPFPVKGNGHRVKICIDCKEALEDFAVGESMEIWGEFAKVNPL